MNSLRFAFMVLAGSNLIFEELAVFIILLQEAFVRNHMKLNK
jgi:hypothetical protein